MITQHQPLEVSRTQMGKLKYLGSVRRELIGITEAGKALLAEQYDFTYSEEGENG